MHVHKKLGVQPVQQYIERFNAHDAAEKLLILVSGLGHVDLQARKLHAVAPQGKCPRVPPLLDAQPRLARLLARPHRELNILIGEVIARIGNAVGRGGPVVFHDDFAVYPEGKDIARGHRNLARALVGFVAQPGEKIAAEGVLFADGFVIQW